MSQNNFFSDVPPWAKGVLVVSAIVGTGILIYTITNKIDELKETKNSREELETAKDDIKTLTNQGQQATLTDFQLNTISNQIKTALSGITEDEAAVYKAFTNVKTDLDVVNLIRVYGTRTIKAVAIWPFPPVSFTGTLGSTLTHYFDSEEMKALNDLLSRKGIKYRF